MLHNSLKIEFIHLNHEEFYPRGFILEAIIGYWRNTYGPKCFLDHNKMIFPMNSSQNLTFFYLIAWYLIVMVCLKITSAQCFQHHLIFPPKAQPWNSSNIKLTHIAFSNFHLLQSFHLLKLKFHDRGRFLYLRLSATDGWMHKSLILFLKFKLS